MFVFSFPAMVVIVQHLMFISFSPFSTYYTNFPTFASVDEGIYTWHCLSTKEQNDLDRWSCASGCRGNDNPWVASCDTNFHGLEANSDRQIIHWEEIWKGEVLITLTGHPLSGAHSVRYAKMNVSTRRETTMDFWSPRWSDEEMMKQSSFGALKAASMVSAFHWDGEQVQVMGEEGGNEWLSSWFWDQIMSIYVNKNQDPRVTNLLEEQPGWYQAM